MTIQLQDNGWSHEKMGRPVVRPVIGVAVLGQNGGTILVGCSGEAIHRVVGEGGIHRVVRAKGFVHCFTGKNLRRQNLFLRC